jgi:hypothetical protein
MQKAQEVMKTDEQELVTVEGLQFKQYQMELMKLMARIYNSDKSEDVN